MIIYCELLLYISSDSEILKKNNKKLQDTVMFAQGSEFGPRYSQFIFGSKPRSHTGTEKS